MTATTSAPPDSAAAPDAADAPAPPPPPDRGVTTISPSVFEKIAARAAAEVDGVQGEVRGGLDRLLRPWTAPSANGPAAASADVEGDGVAFDLTVKVAYPVPVRRVASEIRRRVSTRVAELTGCGVREVNVTVAELVLDERRPARVVR